jgi:hypothetical protein
MKTARPNPKRQKASRIGGLSTYRKYGSEHMKAIGRLGGRPKARILSDNTISNKKSKGEKLPDGLIDLKRLFVEKMGAQQRAPFFK